MGARSAQGLLTRGTGTAGQVVACRPLRRTPAANLRVKQAARVFGEGAAPSEDGLIE